MKKITSIQKVLGGIAVGLFLIATGCSDGELNIPPDGGGSGSLSAPKVTFTASAEEVDRGGSVTLNWEIEGADVAEITAEPQAEGLPFEIKEFKSKLEVANIQQDTTFVLKATKLPPQPATGDVKKEGATPPPADTNPGGSPPAQEPKITYQSVTVQIRKSLSIVEFIADTTPLPDGSYSLSEGGSAVLQWVVEPKEATVTLTASTGEIPVLVPCDAAGREEMLEAGEATTEWPSTGCALVQPTQDTTYTLEAKWNDQVAGPEEVVIKAGSATGEPVIEYFTANGQRGSLEVGSLNEEVELAWKVSPSNSKVSIISEPAWQGTPELPSGSSELTGSLRVIVDQEYAFTLVVEANGKEARETVRVTISTRLACSELSVSTDASPPVFAGESITISWSVSPQAQAIKTVNISTVEGEGQDYDVRAGSAPVTVAGSQYNVSFKDAAGAVVCPSVPVTLPLTTFEGVSEGKAVSAYADAGAVYVGLDDVELGSAKEPSVKGKYIKYGDQGGKTETLTISGYFGDSISSRYLQDEIKTFPVNAFASNSANGRVFIGTTGVVVHKTASDKDWAALPPLVITENSKGDYKGSHPTCFGGTQKGRSGRAIASFSQVCDMVATPDGNFYLAHDLGLYVFNVEKKIGGETPPLVGRDGPLYLSVVNDVDVLSDGSLLAGGAKGVFKSTDSGASWSQVGSGVSGEVYSVATFERVCQLIIGNEDCSSGSGLFAGTSSGLYRTSAEGSWTKVEAVSGRVYSVETTPEAVYVGTDAGLYVSRNGTTFVKVAGTDSVIRDIAVQSGEAGTKIYLATEAGVKRASVAKGARVIIGNPNTPTY